MSRRDQIILTDDEIVEFLSEQRTVILTTNGHDGYPHPMPMWFWRHPDGTIDMATYEKGQKVRNIERDNKVSLLVESGTEYTELKAVFMKGTAELIHDAELAVDTMARMSFGDIDAMEPEQRAQMREAIRPRALKRVVIRVTIDKTISWDHSKLGGTY